MKFLLMGLKFLLFFACISVSNLFADEASINRGKAVYDSVCFACHGINLEGGAGFNLKDGEWVHGAKPEEILKTIKKGFPDKGMVAFETLYSDAQLTDVVNYILSKQEGLRQLEYKIFHGLTEKNKMAEIAWDKLEPDKKGELNPPYVNLTITEANYFGILFKADLLIPETGDYNFKGWLYLGTHLQIFIDDKEVEFTKKGADFSKNIHLAAGSHKFELRFVKNYKLTDLKLTLEKGSSKIPLSISSLIDVRNVTHVLTATNKPLIVRKRINQLPPKSIAVAFPAKINCSFNPNNGSINALWFGEFLDIAPNINDRGADPSKNLGKYLFAGENGIDLLVDGKSVKINFQKYTLYDNPSFYFDADNVTVNLTLSVQDKMLALTYKKIAEREFRKLSLKIPDSLDVFAGGEKQKTKQGILEINNQQEFTILIAPKEVSK